MIRNILFRTVPVLALSVAAVLLTQTPASAQSNKGGGKASIQFASQRSNAGFHHGGGGFHHGKGGYYPRPGFPGGGYCGPKYPTPPHCNPWKPYPVYPQPYPYPYPWGGNPWHGFRR